MGEGIRRIDLVVGVLLLAGEANERLRQPVRVVDIIEAEAAFDAEPVLIRRPVAAFRIDDLLVLDVVGHLAADAAIGAKRIDLAVGPDGARLLLVEEGRGHQGAGRAGLHALPASDAGRFPHRVVEVEHDLGARVAVGHADHIVDLHLAAAAHAEPALDAGVEIDAHGGMARIGSPAFGRREAARRDAGLVRPAPQLRARVMGGLARRLIGDEQLHHHLARLLGALGRGLDLHAGRGACACRRRRARARPRSRPCRRGNCRRPGSRARADSKDAGSRCRGVAPLARWSRRASPRQCLPSSSNTISVIRRPPWARIPRGNI